MCPGTDVYMPPGAVQDEPVYTEKIDCFSFGVITVQILTQQFPKPGNRRKKIQINHPGLPSGTMAEVLISETERRQNHISKIDPNHILLPIALDCLKDRDVERPSAQQLCERVTTLKESPEYCESVRTAQERSTSEQSRRDRELRSLEQQHAQQIQDLQQVMRQKDQTIAEQRQQLDEVHQLVREKNQVIAEKERQLGRINQQLEESEQVISQFQRRISELEQLRLATDTTSRSKQQSSSGDSIKLTWREEKKAPFRDSSDSYNGSVVSGILYVRLRSRKVYSYTVSTSTWSQLPDSPTHSCPLVIINNLPTLIGGQDDSRININKLFSLTGEGSGRRWTEEFPPMPTK